MLSNFKTEAVKARKVGEVSLSLMSLVCLCVSAMCWSHLLHPLCILEVQRQSLGQLYILPVHALSLLVKVLHCHVVGLLSQPSHLAIGLLLESVLQGGERGGGGDEGTGIRGVVYKGGKLKRRETDMDARWKERGEYTYVPIRTYVHVCT